MSEPQHDLTITADRVFCDATGLDGPGAVAVNGDRIVASGSDVPADGRRALDFPDCLLLPGFVDMHAHPAPSGWKYAMDPDTDVLPRGSTTILSQGDTGPANWAEYLDTVIKPAKTRIRMAISPARTGEEDEGFVFRDMSDIDVDACVAAIEDGGEHIWGLAVNISDAGTGPNDPRRSCAELSRPPSGPAGLCCSVPDANPGTGRSRTSSSFCGLETWSRTASTRPAGCWTRAAR